MIEKRDGDVESRTALGIANVFGVSVRWLSLGEGDPPVEEEVRAAVARAREAAVAAAAAATPEAS